jgi:predicted RNase H-like HicB family nuclease
LDVYKMLLVDGSGHRYLLAVRQFWPRLLCASWEDEGLARLRLMRHNSRMKKEFVFQIEKDEDMLAAVCHDPEMATQGENLDELLAMIRDLIRCRFDEGDEQLIASCLLCIFPR